MSKIKRRRLKTQEDLCSQQSETTISLYGDESKWKRNLLNKRRLRITHDAFRKLTDSTFKGVKTEF